MSLVGLRVLFAILGVWRFPTDYRQESHRSEIRPSGTKMNLLDNNFQNVQVSNLSNLYDLILTDWYLLILTFLLLSKFTGYFQDSIFPIFFRLNFFGYKKLVFWKKWKKCLQLNLNFSYSFPIPTFSPALLFNSVLVKYFSYSSSRFCNMRN